ncbi:substrate-binding periplasmic protein [Aliamphritea hakodatensis]|uniref:substrate-binding periplasmic protein n=1 Tax=Aliamphritea hakodatensis TaxID=2895352 RepID=UPI0022FD96B6|nr:transporter substrate-binding domain-containing protein [Aliamphritea hakodatensis]
MKAMILCGLLFCIFLPPAQASQTIVLSTIQRLPISTDLQTGLADRIATEAFRRIGIQAVIKKIPARRALRDANAGLHDGDLARIAGVTHTYPNLLPVPEITWVAEIVAFSKNRQLTTPDWSSLETHRLSYIRGWVVFENNLPDTPMIDKVVSPEALFKMLKMNRADLALYEKKMGYGLLRQQQITNIHALQPALTIEPIYIYLHRKHESLIPRLANAIRAMKQDGSYQAILEDCLGEVLNPASLQDYIRLQQSYDNVRLQKTSPQ